MRYADTTFGSAEAVMNKLGGPEGIERFLAGDSEIVIRRHVINTTLPPHYDDESFAVARHTPLRLNKGRLHWDLTQIGVLQVDRSAVENGMSIEDYLREVSDESFLNARVRDYLMKYPSLIPEAWQVHTLCFAGTIFRGRRGRYLPTLQFSVGEWYDIYEPMAEKLKAEMVVVAAHK